MRSVSTVIFKLLQGKMKGRKGPLIDEIQHACQRFSKSYFQASFEVTAVLGKGSFGNADELTEKFSTTNPRKYARKTMKKAEVSQSKADFEAMNRELDIHIYLNKKDSAKYY